MTSADGEKYSGQYSIGTKHGQGVMQYKNGDIFTGHWEFGSPKSGQMCFESGKKYIGEWCDPCPHGFGTMFYPDGQKYEGYWKFFEKEGVPFRMH